MTEGPCNINVNISDPSAKTFIPWAKTDTPEKPDLVNHPPHYETNGIECIDAMRASQGDSAVKSFCICNAFKYIWRHMRKNSELEDLKKAVWYLNKAIEIEQNKEDK